MFTEKKCRALCRAVLLTSWHSYIRITSLLRSIKPNGVAYSAQDTLNPPTRPRVSASQSGDPQRSADSTETDPIQADHRNRIGQQAAQGSWQKATVIQRQTDRSHKSYLVQTVSSARYIRNRHHIQAQPSRAIHKIQVRPQSLYPTQCCQHHPALSSIPVKPHWIASVSHCQRSVLGNTTSGIRAFLPRRSVRSPKGPIEEI